MQPSSQPSVTVISSQNVVPQQMPQLITNPMPYNQPMGYPQPDMGYPRQPPISPQYVEPMNVPPPYPGMYSPPSIQYEPDTKPTAPPQ